MAQNKLVSYSESVATKKHFFGVAIDLGAASIVLSLCDLKSQQELATYTCANPLLSLLNDMKIVDPVSSLTSKERHFFREQLLEAINLTIKKGARRAGVKTNSIYAAVVVGSMQIYSILQDISLTSLKKLTHSFSDPLSKNKLNLLINKNSAIHFVPPVNKYIGSEIIALILSLRIFKKQKPFLCVDLGSGGSVILGSSKQLKVFFAGSKIVFEGNAISNGMVPDSGAIEWVRLKDNKVKLLTIGHIRPKGLCGTGMIDIVSELLRNKIIDRQGRMKNTFILYEDKNTKIEFTAIDLKLIQKAKTSIAAIIQTILFQEKIRMEDIGKVFVVGAIGDYENKDNITRIGLIPKQLKEKIKFIPNASSLGAKLILLSFQELQTAMALRSKVEYKSLIKDEKFQASFRKLFSFPKS